MPKQVQTDLIHRYHSATVNNWSVENRLTYLWHSPAGVSLSDLVLNRRHSWGRSQTDLCRQGQECLYRGSSLAREPGGQFSQRTGRTQNVCYGLTPTLPPSPVWRQLPRQSHRSQLFWGKSPARKKTHLQPKSTPGLTVQPSCLISAAVKAGRRWGKVSLLVWGFPQLTKAAEKPQEPFLLPAPATVLFCSPPTDWLELWLEVGCASSQMSSPTRSFPDREMNPERYCLHKEIQLKITHF